MTISIKTIKRLEERRAKIDSEIKRIKSKLSKEKRKKDTRRKILIGSAILAKMKAEGGNWSEPWYEDNLRKMMDNYLTRNRDRLLFDLPIKK